MKRLKQLFTALLLLCSATVWAQNFEVDGVYYNITSSTDKTVEVAGVTSGFSGNLVIPSSVSYAELVPFATFDSWTSSNTADGSSSQNEYTLTVEAGDALEFDWSVSSESGYDKLIVTIGGTEVLNKSGEDSGSFVNFFDTAGTYSLVVKYTKDGSASRGSDQAKVQNVVLSRENSNTEIYSVTRIGGSAFYGCTGLTSIEIPNSVTSIGGSAFYGCTGLENIVVAEGNTVYDSRENCNAIIETATNTLCVGFKNTIIPNSVTSIGYNAFKNCTGLTSIEIPSSVTNIGYNAFYGCTGLTSIEIPNSVTSIGDYAFSGCTGLTSIEIPSSVTNIGYSAFEGCTGLTSIEIPNSVTRIEGYTFEGCTRLTSIEIPNSVTTIGGSAFSGCTGLTSITIPSGVTNIEYEAFKGCSSINTFTSNVLVAPTIEDGAFDFGGSSKPTLIYPTGSNYISWGAYFGNFESGSSYNSDVTYVQDAEGRLYISGSGSIGTDYYFSNNSDITSVYIEEGITEIPDNAFYGCNNLKEVYLPSTLTKIGSYAFFGCSIRFCVIPQSVTTIGECAFDNGIYVNDEYKYTYIVFESYTVPTMPHCSFNIIVPYGAVGYQCLTKEYSDTDQYYIDGTTMFVFGDCSAFGSWSDHMEGYDTVDTIYIYPKRDSTGDIYSSTDWLRNMPNVKELEVKGYFAGKDSRIYSLPGCNAIFANHEDYSGSAVLLSGCASTVIPNSITIIGNSAFSGCTGLASIEIPNSVTSIDYWAFSGCTGLTSIEIPNSVTSIGYSAFEGCTGLTSIEIPNSVTSIGSYAFYGCTGLTSIEIPNSVTSIGGSAFYGCTGLESIIVAEGNTVYDSRDNCNAIIETANNKLLAACRNTVFPSTVTAVAGDAFGAFAGKDVVVPASVTSIDNCAFRGVNNVHFESTVPATINGDIFGTGAIYVPSAAYADYCQANVWSDYSARIVTAEIADKTVEVTAQEGMSGVLEAVGLADVEKLVKIKVKGSINSYDIIVFRDKTPILSEIDLSEATVVASTKPFYQTYCTGNNSLGGYAFYDLDKLRSVKLPKDLVTLGDYAFNGCGNICSVDASAAGELNIGNYTFNYCQALEEVILPETVAEIGNYAFSSCNSLKDISFKNLTGNIGSYAFNNCTNLSKLELGNVGGNIVNNAFSSCSNLADVKFGTVSGNVERYAFSGCSKLENLSFEALEGELADNALNNCSKLKNVVFGKGPKVIGSQMFLGSTNIESFVAGEGTVTVKDKAFGLSNYWNGEKLEKLKKVVLPSTVENIGSYAFYRCSALSEFTMPAGVASIGEQAFSECRSLESITIPNKIKTIPASAFYGCSSLKSVTFPDSLLSIGNSAFRYTAVEEIKLPPTLETISSYAFGSCENLAALHIPSSVKTIENYSFSGCNKLLDVYTYTIEPTSINENTFSTFSTARLHVPATSFWNYYWDIGWAKFNQNNFQDFNEPYEYFYLNNDYVLDDETGYIEGTPDADLNPGSGLIVEGEQEDSEEPNQSLGDVNLGHDGEGTGGSIIADNNLHVDNLNIKINVKGGRWYFFAFPFDIKFSKITMQNGSDYVFRYYDGEERAKNGHGGWKNVNENHLKAGRGYIFQCSADDVLMASIEDIRFKKEDKFNELVAHVSENLDNASWNFMGNPYLCYYDMADMDYTAPVTVWDGEKYVAIRPGDDDYHFAPYEAFFVQKPEGKENVGFGGDHKMTHNQSKSKKNQQKAARRARGIDPSRLIVNMVIGDGETTDLTRVVFNERQTHNYEPACDAAKFTTEGIVQIYTMDNDGVHYAINERPVGNGVVPVGYTAVTGGQYTIEVERMDTPVILYDAVTGEMHDFSDGAYEFTTDAGTFEQRFSLGMRDDNATGIEDMPLDEAVKAVDGGIQFSGNAVAKVYNAAGAEVAVQNGAGVLYLPAGTYVVSVGNENVKVVVK